MSAAESVRPRVRRCAWQFRRSRLQIDRAFDDRMPSSEYECAGRCSFRLLLIKNRRHQILRHLLKMRRFHRITRAAFGERTNRGRVAEEFSKRNFGVNNRQMAYGFYAADAAATPAQIPANVALKFLRCNVFHLHDRLEQDRLALFEAVFHRENRCQLKRQFAGIDFVETSINNINLHIDHWVTTKNTIQHRFIDALFYRGNVFARNDAADDFIFDDQAAASRAGTHIYFDVAILTATTGLFDQLTDAVRVAGNRFAIRDLRFARVRVDFELAEHTIANDLQMQFAHAGDDRLAGVFVRVNAERWIFFGKTLQRDTHLFLIQFCLWLDGH